MRDAKGKLPTNINIVLSYHAIGNNAEKKNCILRNTQNTCTRHQHGKQYKTYIQKAIKRNKQIIGKHKVRNIITRVLRKWQNGTLEQDATILQVAAAGKTTTTPYENSEKC